MKILDVRNIKKIYSKKGVKKEALSNINFSVLEGEFIAIMGESGSGKTTLLNIIATLLKQTEGDIFVEDRNINLLSEKEISAFRRNKLGFVFQEFNLLDAFSNKDNIFLPLVLSDYKYDEMEKRLQEIAPILKIEDIINKFPYEVSGGEKQRIAIARALITKPSLILSDEPTGALDSKSSDNIMNLFKTINEKNQTILMVTHSLKAASYASRVLFIKDGVVYHEIYKGDESRKEFMERINKAEYALNGR